MTGPRLCSFGNCAASLTILNTSGRCRRHARTGRSFSNVSLLSYWNDRFEESMALLDDEARRCYSRNFETGATRGQALSLARDDMLIRHRLAAVGNRSTTQVPA